MPARRGSQNAIPEIEKLTGSRENSRGKQNQATKNNKNLAMATLLYINVTRRGDLLDFATTWQCRCPGVEEEESRWTDH